MSASASDASAPRQDLRSALGRARGHGSAHTGVEHWWLQRVTAVASLLLLLWFVFSLIGLAGADREGIIAWLSTPCNATLAVLTILAAYYHAALGVQVVLEDYVAHKTVRLALILASRFGFVFLGTLSVISILKLAFGG